MHEIYVAGIDGGTSHMETAIVNGRGEVLGRGTSGPSNNPNGPGMNPWIGEHLVQGILAALQHAGLETGDLRAISLNLSGEPVDLTLENARRWLAPLSLPDDCVLSIEEDGLSAWAAAAFPDPAIWVLLGTHWGSAGIRNGTVVPHPLDNNGLDADTGELGSGSALGSRALAAAVRSHYGGPPTRLFEACCAFLGVESAEELVAWARTHEAHDLRARLCKVAATVAQWGDPIAVDLFSRAAEGVADATSAMAHALGVAASPVTVVIAGNVWNAGSVLLSPFRRALGRAVPTATVHLNTLTQAEGAALLALRSVGVEPRAETYTNIGRRR